jgi:integrase
MKALLTTKFLESPLDPATKQPLVLPAEGKRLRIWDKHTNGLGIRITSKGAKSFFVVRRVKGRGAAPVSIVLGTYPDMSLAEARERADDLLRDLRKGVDPRERAAEERQAKAATEAAEQARRVNVFANVVETFVKRYVASKRTAGPITQLVRREFVSRWGARPITEVGRADVITMLEEIAEDSPSAAHQALIYLRLLFDWAIERDDYGLKSSPCHPIKVSRLIPNLPKRRQRVLDADEMRLVWRAAWPANATDEDVYPTGQFIRLLLVLGCRRGELAEMTWDELGIDKSTWLLKGERTKNGDPRIIPLPRLAVDMLAAMPRFTGPFVFSTTYGRRPISGFAKIKQALDRKIGKLNDGKPILGWRVHDLRRSMRTNLSAIPSISPLVAELMIGHRQRGIAAVYDLHAYEAEQRAGFEAWCARLASIIDPPSGANVVPLASARA